MTVDNLQLFPFETPKHHPSGRPYEDIDQWTQSVRDSERVDPYYQQGLLKLQGTGIAPDPDGLKRRIDVVGPSRASDTVSDAFEGDQHPDYFDNWRDRIPTATETAIGKTSAKASLDVIRRSTTEPKIS
jgi:hypothetical protein